MRISNKRAHSAAKCALAFGVALSLGACSGSLSESLGYGKESPDEFAIVTKAPLVIPPDYSLRPPRPGAPSPRATSPHAAAQSALLGTPIGEGDENRTAGEQTLLANAGAVGADSSIRELIDDETRALKHKDERFLDDVLFWQQAQEPNRVVNAGAEAQRIRENQAQGRPVTEGETPDRDDSKDGGLIDYLFN